MTPVFIEPDWPAPANILALSTTRGGGVSAAPYDSFNLAHHVGDDPASVAANRDRLAGKLPAGVKLQWLSQVHGTAAVQAPAEIPCPDADACWTGRTGIACAVLTADCLPVLLCSDDGSRIAAVHAGWRGLAAGVLEAAVAAMVGDPARLMAWLGPAIGPAHFEVGPEVRTRFLASAPAALSAEISGCFAPSENRPGHYLAELSGLARLRLTALGIREIYGGTACTFSDSDRFFSYRRDGQTGRMATLILRTAD